MNLKGKNLKAYEKIFKSILYNSLIEIFINKNLYVTKN